MDWRTDKDGLVPMKKTQSSESRASTDSAQSNRRRSNSGLGSGWLKKLSSKVTGSDTEPGIFPRRKNSAGSVMSTSSQNDSDGELNDLPPARRSRSHSQTRIPEAKKGDTSASIARSAPSTSTMFHASRGPEGRTASPTQATVTQFAPGQFSGSRRASTTSQHDCSEAPRAPSSPRNSSFGPKPNMGVFGTRRTSEGGHGNKPAAVPERKSTFEGRPTAEKRGTVDDGHVTLTELKKRRISTRAVGFAASIFMTNPPQRIPPLNPQPGNIEFLDDGTLITKTHTKFSAIHGGEPLFLQERHAEVSRLAQVKASENAERLHNSLIYSNPGGRSAFHSFFGHGNSTADEDEPANQRMADFNVNVDGFVPEEDHWEDAESGDNPQQQQEKLQQLQQQDALPPPDEVYTRCCHLREIMPIRNILRQLKGQLVPLPRIRIANTKPTLVEIQAFSDFLTVVPVASLALDNHILTDEMIRLILVGLSRSTFLARLTLVNTKLSPLGWQYLCSFLAYSNTSKSLMALDISCTNPTGIPHRVPAFTRRNADWRLFSDALSVMGNVEELTLGGTEINFVDLRYLLEGGFKQGKLLSVANNQLNHHDVTFIAEWANRPESRLTGIDLSGNDLSRDEDQEIVPQLLSSPRIIELTLRNAHLTAKHASRIVNTFTAAQASQSKLRRLDLSGNPKLFPSIMGRLTVILHRFPDLTRLRLESCNLTNDQIVTLCETLSHCHRLVHVSFSGNTELNETAATALCVAVHLSRTIVTVEPELPEHMTILRNQLARYCLINLERTTGMITTSLVDEHEHEDISSFHDELRAVAAEINNSPAGDTPPPVEPLVERIDQLRSKIKLRMQPLLMKRRSGPLSVVDRETTMRLFFFGTTLDRLRREVLGQPSDAQPGEELVNKVDLAEERPSMARQQSLQSLRKLEREEAETHIAYADRFMHLEDSELLEAVDKLQVGDLGRIIGE